MINKCIVFLTIHVTVPIVKGPVMLRTWDLSLVFTHSTLEFCTPSQTKTDCHTGRQDIRYSQLIVVISVGDSWLSLSAVDRISWSLLEIRCCWWSERIQWSIHNGDIAFKEMLGGIEFIKLNWVKDSEVF